MKHKFVKISLLSLSVLGLASCGNEDPVVGSSNDASSAIQSSIAQSSAIESSSAESSIASSSVAQSSQTESSVVQSSAEASSSVAQSSQAESSVVQSSAEASSQAESSQVQASSEAQSSATQSSIVESSVASSSAAETFTKVTSTVYMVGDSTMCNYPTLDTYYYPRYGYGTQMDKYLDTDYITVNNLALSGRSSVSFLSESNYTTLKNGIKAGDYLIIGWGHNDEKYGTATFRNAKYNSIEDALADPDSFQSCVYNNYVKLALDAGATPILCSPIVRASSSNDYSEDKGHVTAYGDYRQAVEDLAEYYDITFIDLTTATKVEYTKIGYDEAIKYHAIKTGTDESEGQDPNWNSVDTTHINYYGANYVCYEFVNQLKDTNNTLKYYITNTTKPTSDILTKYDGYKWAAYKSPNLGTYTAPSHLSTITEGWYGTAFGDTGGDPASSVNGYIAKETSAGVFSVGQALPDANTKYKGKISSSSEGEAFLFKQISSTANFTLTADAVVTSYYCDNKQGGFGLTLKDACWLNVKDNTLLTNSVNAGILVNSATASTVNFSRDSSGLVKTNNTCAAIKEGMKASFTIKREGQTVYVTTKVYTSETAFTEYKTTYTDFDFVAKDADYMYVGMFAARGIIAEFTNVVYTYDGEASQA